MAQAFTREIDDAPLPPLPERPVSPHLNLVTRRGAALIEEALHTLKAQIGATSEKDREAILARDLRYWFARRATMQVVEPDRAADTVGFGTTAVIRRRGKVERLRIVGEDEAEPPKGLIAWTAPLAKALEGGRVGEIIHFVGGGKDEPIEILAIETADA
ncbi:GreA/GreB family elongation factor [Aureimonas populi]|uniref:GreA/GreB family elongation factor n=1 Tax=Aureimonas populi TaxID=1701758 RepID=A0ABW5CRQ2_9HYPH|nr:GreA/GreB family elongation factor [Aureimonas populi]